MADDAPIPETSEPTEEPSKPTEASSEPTEPVMVLDLEPVASQWTGRSAVFVGDSITAGSGTDKIYYEYVWTILHHVYGSQLDEEYQN